MTKVFQHTDGRLIAVPEGGKEPLRPWRALVTEEFASEAVEKLQDAQLEILQKIASALGIDPTTPGHLPMLIHEEIEFRRVGAEQQQAWLKQIATALGLDGSGIISNPRPLIAAIDDLRSKMMTDWSKQVGQNDYEVITELADIMGCDGTASDVLKTAKRWTKLRHWLDEVIKASGHAPEITPSQPLIDRVVGSIQELRKRVGEQMDEARAEGAPRRHPHRDPVAQLATELYRMTTGGTELPAANPATADRYRRGARAILAAVRR